MAQIKCYTCRDEGLESPAGCPDCGLVQGENYEVQRVVETTDLTDKAIPEYYHRRLWEKEILLRAKPELLNDRYFTNGSDAYVEQLNKAHDIFKNGGLPKTSAIIVAPQTFSKMTWAYSCMQLARAFNYNIVPLMDTQQLKYFITLSEEKPSSSYLKRFHFTYEDLIFADILFLTVSKGYYRRNAWEVIQQILDIRSRLGLATIILSRFNINEISEFDRFDRFTKSMDYNGTENGLRYPAIIRYIDKFVGGVF